MSLCSITPITTNLVGIILLILVAIGAYASLGVHYKELGPTNYSYNDREIFVIVGGVVAGIYSIHNILMTTFCGVNCNNN